MRIGQVELNNSCNLKCEYCPRTYLMTRKIENMNEETFLKVIEFYKKYPSDILRLYNFGEPLLHPNLINFIKIATKNNIKTQISTNGLLLNKDILRLLIDAGLSNLKITKHIGIKLNLELLKYLLEKIDYYIEDRNNNLLDWAGQVKINDNEKSKKIIYNYKKCKYLTQNLFVVLPNGNINPCCHCVNDYNLNLTIDDLLNGKEYKAKTFDLCYKCGFIEGE
jgi:sulfatase maturation enzyme AslB (radical SAM superfamily)